MKAQNNPLTPNQLRMIWALARERDLEEDDLRDMVEEITKARSISGLTIEQAGKVIDRLTGKSARESAIRKPEPEIANRHGMATMRQINKIRAMWNERARAKEKESALCVWLRNRFGISHPNFLTRDRASQVIVALGRMEVING